MIAAAVALYCAEAAEPKTREGELRKRKRRALADVAEHFSAPWQAGEGPPDGYITMAGRRIAIEVAIVKQRIVDPRGVVEPRLRYDKVALAFVRGLGPALRELAPRGRTAIVTIAAPIR